MDLRGAQIGGQMSCIGGRFDGKDGDALNGNALTVTAGLFLRDGFQAKGDIDLVGASVGGNVEIAKASLDGDLIAEGLTVGGTFAWRQVSGKVPNLSLAGARLGLLADDRTSWGIVATLLPHRSPLRQLDGELSVAERIRLA